MVRNRGYKRSTWVGIHKKNMKDEIKLEKGDGKTFEVYIENPTKIKTHEEITGIKLLEDQQKGLEALLLWCETTKGARTPESLLFALTGSAGTGKTTLLGAFLNSIYKYYRKHRVCICAPTHKAKKIIQSKTKWESSETLQALLGLKLETNLEDFDVNNPVFNPIGDRKIRDYDLVVIDESSMVNEDLYNLVVECATQSGTHVLFTGDTMQLNPVKEIAVSPALITPLNKYHLTQVIRQADTNPLLIVLEMLREDIQNGTNNYIDYLNKNKSQINDKGEGYEVLEGNKFAETVKEVFNSDNFKTDKNYCRYIAWTNQSIMDTNRHIRKHVFNHQVPLVVGDLLLSYKTLTAGKNGDTLMVNSDDYIIESIEETMNQEFDLKIYSCIVRGIDTGSKTRLNFLIPEVNNYANFVEIHDKLIDKAKYGGGGKKWVPFFKFREQFILLETLLRDPKVSATKYNTITKKDIDFGYGITIHKSQGSTYNTVFVNGKDINKNINETERKRLWYVALSRTSNKVFINL
jgi:ATP-dependent exoDNAse (exonuclease V) alpha subunit